MTARKNNHKTPPPTVLTITLNSDGSGTVLICRGELAHLSQFHYDGLAEIVEAMTASAEQLLAVEKNPPSLAILGSASNSTPTVSVATEADEIELDPSVDTASDEESTEPTAVPQSELPTDEISETVSSDIHGVTAIPDTSQPSLF